VDESHFKALREISREGTLSQRDLAGRIGLSLGRVNYIVHSLIKAGYIKARRFKNARNKLAYMYVLTPSGLSAKLRVTGRFLEQKSLEYERLRSEIEDLEREVLKSSLRLREGRE
jgi:EPS-associated MarR family transcriptional regulator